MKLLSYLLKDWLTGSLRWHDSLWKEKLTRLITPVQPPNKEIYKPSPQAATFFYLFQTVGELAFTQTLPYPKCSFVIKEQLKRCLPSTLPPSVSVFPSKCIRWHGDIAPYLLELWVFLIQKYDMEQYLHTYYSFE